MLKKFFRQPLIQFAVAGCALFALYRAVAPRPPGRRIDVTSTVIDGLAADFQRRTGVAATVNDRAALAGNYVDHELLYREALALGLDRGDVIVRRRLIQKMQFYLEELDATPEPTDAQLQAWLDEHRQKYAGAARVTLEQVFVAGQDARAGAEAARLRSAIAGGGDPARLGDAFAHGRILRGRSQRELAALLGEGFAAAALQLLPGEWSAPIRSAYGLHLVRVLSKEAPPPPSLDSVREALRRDWRAAERAKLDRAALEKLRSKYDVHLAERG